MAVQPIVTRCLVDASPERREKPGARLRLFLSPQVAAKLGVGEETEAYLHVVQARNVLEDTEFYTNLSHAGFVCRVHLITDPALHGWQVNWSGDLGRGAPEVGHVYADLIFPTPASGLLVWMWPAYMFRYYFDLQVAGEKGSRELLLYAPHAGPAELATVEEYTGELVAAGSRHLAAIVYQRRLDLQVKTVLPRPWRWGQLSLVLSRVSIDLARATLESQPLASAPYPVEVNTNPSYAPVRDAYLDLLHQYPRAAVGLHGLGHNREYGLILGTGVAGSYRLTEGEEQYLAALLEKYFGGQIAWKISPWGHADAGATAGPILEIHYDLRIDHEKRDWLAYQLGLLLADMVEAGLLL